MALVEFRSALALKIRANAIQEADRILALRRLENDLHLGYLKLFAAPSAALYAAAGQLLDRYAAEQGLRTLDALQLAAASLLHRGGWVDTLLTSDQRM